MSNTRIIVTGGSGFIGTNLCEYLIEKNYDFINLDINPPKVTGHREYWKEIDIRDKGLLSEIIEYFKPTYIINLAADLGMDHNSLENLQTNIIGTFNLLEAARRLDLKKFIQISTDEVYGSLSNESPMSKEGDLLKPRSPYSASKAAAEQIALSYFHTYGLPVIISRSSNNYGPYQFPEKLIPLFVTNLIEDKKVTLMYSAENPGLNVRDWLYVKDNCQAIWELIEKGEAGEIYNISGNNEKTNVEITETILSSFGVGKEMVEYIPHRKGHDFRYAIDASKIENQLVWKADENFETGLQKLNLTHWWSRVRNPKDNAQNERFNRTLQEEFIQLSNYTNNVEAFNRNLTNWLIEYNFHRPHQSLDYLF